MPLQRKFFLCVVATGTKALGESKPHSFTALTMALLKCFQVSTQTALLDLLAEGQPCPLWYNIHRLLLSHLVLAMASNEQCLISAQQ